MSIRPYDAYKFDIYDDNNKLFASCRPSAKFRCFLISDDFFLGDFYFRNEEKEIIRMHFEGFLGRKRSLIHKEDEFAFPRRFKDVKFHDAIFSFHLRWNGSLTATTTNEAYLDELICVASYLWYRDDRIRQL